MSIAKSQLQIMSV